MSFRLLLTAGGASSPSDDAPPAPSKPRLGVFPIFSKYDQGRAPTPDGKREPLFALAGMISLIFTVLGGLSLVLGLVAIDRFRSQSELQTSSRRWSSDGDRGTPTAKPAGDVAADRYTAASRLNRRRHRNTAAVPRAYRH